MDLLKIAGKRSLWSEIVYVALNVALALVILLVIITTGSLALALVLVLLSKWRIFAVRPRYWFAHVQSNLIDIIVTLSFTVLIYSATGALVLQGVLTALFVAWLLFLKPRSNRGAMTLQAATAVFGGVTALAIVSPDWNALFVVIGFWLIGYGAARHVLVAYDEGTHILLFSLLWGLVMAELGWLTYYWTIAYQFSGSGLVMIPQVAIIALLVGFLAERAYRSYHYHRTIRSSDVLLPTLLVVSVVLLLTVFFNATPNSLI